MHSHEARSPCYENARHVPGVGVRKCARKFKFDCFAGARNVRGATKINSDFGQPENTDPPGCKYRYYAKRLALKLSLSTKFRKMTSEFLQSKIKILFFKEGSWGWGRDVPSSIETKPEQILHKYYTVHNNILNNGHNNLTLHWYARLTVN